MTQSRFEVTSIPPRRWRARGVAAVAGACLALLPVGLHAHDRGRPSVPPALEVSSAYEVFLVGHAVGTQDYVCAASGSGVAFVLTTPEAVLFDTPARRVVNHYFSPNPVEGGTIRATWQSTRDSSVFWGKLAASATFQTDSTQPWQ